MTPKELLDNAVKYEGGRISGVFNDDQGRTFVYNSMNERVFVHPGDYLVQLNVHKLQFEVVSKAMAIVFQSESAQNCETQI